MDGRTDRQMDGHTDGWMDGWTDGWMEKLVSLIIQMFTLTF